MRSPSRQKGARKAAQPIAEKIDVPGARPAVFKLVDRGPDSFFVYRSSRKIGTARVEPGGEWTARFEDGGKRWNAAAESGPELLRQVATFLLTLEARAAAARPLAETNPKLQIKGKKSPEQKLSLEFAARAQKRRIAELDDELLALRKSIKPAPAG